MNYDIRDIDRCIFYKPLYMNLNLRASGSYRKVNDSAGSERNGKRGGARKAQRDMRYEIIYKPGQ